jgi:hypothetical protein
MRRESAAHRSAPAAAVANAVDQSTRARRHEVHREKCQAEHAERLPHALRRRLIDGERRPRRQGHGEGQSLHRAQRIDERPHRVDEDEAEGRGGHHERTRGEKAAAAEAVDRGAHQRQKDHGGDPVRRRDVPDLLRASRECQDQILRQQKEARERVAKAGLGHEQHREAAREKPRPTRRDLSFQHGSLRPPPGCRRSCGVR